MLPAQHLKGARNIAACFGVGRNTVSAWIKAGAPIFLVGRKHQANYVRLAAWLEQTYALTPAPPD
jgi:transposase